MSRFGNLLPMLLAALLAGTLSVSSVAADDDDDDGSAFPSSLIAFSSTDRAGLTGSDIWVIDPNNPSRLTQLTSTPESDTSPVWSPDGSRIAFSRYRLSDNTVSLWVVNADGTGERQILDWWPRGVGSIAPHFWYSRDPVGERVYYVRDPGGGPCYFRWTYADGAPSQIEQPVIGAENKCSPAISPDQQKIVFFDYGAGHDLQIGVLSADGTAVNNIQVLFPLPAAQYEMSDPAWSPDGKRIAFAMDPAGYRSNIYTIAADGTRLLQITYFKAFRAHSTSPSWSPDGEWLAFTVLNVTSGVTDVYVAPSDGSFSLVANLTGDRTPDGQTDWSPVPEYRIYLPLFVYRWEHAR